MPETDQKITQLRKLLLMLFFTDRSGSMGKHQKAVYDAQQYVLRELQKENETNVDIECRVGLWTFNSEVEDCTEGFAPPEDVAEYFTEDEYVCTGLTGLAAVYDAADKLFSRSPGGLFADLKPGDPAPVFVMTTDMNETDSEASIAAARDRLLRNRLFTSSKRIVIYVGDSESKKKAAAHIAGGTENVIFLGDSLKEHLAPVMLSATLMHSDSTHISNLTTTPEETGKHFVKKQEAGKQSQNAFRDSQLEQELEDYLTGKIKLTSEEVKKKMDEYLAQ